MRQPITLQRLPQGDTFEQIVSSVEGIIDYDGIMYAGCLCKLYLLYGSVQALADGFLGFRSASRETLMENRKARRCDEKVGGFYRRPLDKTYSLILLVNIREKRVQEVVKKIKIPAPVRRCQGWDVVRYSECRPRLYGWSHSDYRRIARARQTHFLLSISRIRAARRSGSPFRELHVDEVYGWCLRR